MVLLITIIVFLTIFFSVLTVYFLKEDNRRKVKNTLLIRLLPAEEALPHHFYRLNSQVADSHDFWLAKKIRKHLEIANMEIPVKTFIFYCSLISVITLILFLFLTGPLTALTMSLLSGGLGPFLYIMYRRHKRENALVAQLPDAVDMISRGLRSGLNLDDSLKEIARSFSDPIGPEFRRMYEEMALGLSFEQAIRGLESRFVRVHDVKILCAAFLIQRETGGNLTSILDTISRTIRSRLVFFRQVQALGTEGRVSAYILGSLPFLFALITWFIQPDYINLLFTEPAGKTALSLALIFEMAGFALMYRMGKVEV